MEIEQAIRELKKVAKSHGLKLKLKSYSIGTFIGVVSADGSFISGTIYAPSAEFSDFSAKLESFRNDEKLNDLIRIIKSKKGYFFSD